MYPPLWFDKPEIPNHHFCVRDLRNIDCSHAILYQMYSNFHLAVGVDILQQVPLDSLWYFPNHNYQTNPKPTRKHSHSYHRSHNHLVLFSRPFGFFEKHSNHTSQLLPIDDFPNKRDGFLLELHIPTLPPLEDDIHCNVMDISRSNPMQHIKETH